MNKHLSARGNWQKHARVVGDKGETDFASLLSKHLPEYYRVFLKDKINKMKVYNEKNGIVLDILVQNTITGKSLLIEKKTGNNGGNAHERIYKFLSPPLKEKVKKMNPDLAAQPFFFVFSGKTFQKRKYKDEIKLLLGGENYAIMEYKMKNIKQVANQIMEIV